MIERNGATDLARYLKYFPAVGIIGPRQCGKSTLVLSYLKSKKNSLYLDLENPDDRAKLTNPTLFFSENKHPLICLDEVQFMPNIFPVLRSIIDRNKRNGQFILLGSASPALLRQSSETLAGRIHYMELAPFTLGEVAETKNASTKLWLRGGFPRSFLASKEDISFVWRKNFIRTFLERDLSTFGVGTSAEAMRRFWMMCAHLHGQPLNLSNFGGALGVTHPTVKSYVDIMLGTFMLQKLEPFQVNIQKRIRKTPKIYLADSGILHALLNIRTMNELLGHPVAGFSWEGFVLSQLTAALRDWEIFYVTTADQAEIDFILRRGKHLIAVETKLSQSPSVSRGFYTLMNDLNIKEGYVVAPVDVPFRVSDKAEVMNVGLLLEKLTRKR
jgi:predicted AAA+ superfamily ATPase